MAECVQSCNPDIGRSVASTITIDDQTNVVSPDCSDVLMLTIEDGGGQLSTTRRTMVITSIQEAKTYFTAAGEVVRAAKDYFPNLDRGLKTYIKLGYWDSANETITEALDAIAACDNCFLTITTTHDIQDDNVTADLDIASWATANEKIYFWVSSDDDNLNSSLSTSPKGEQAALELSNSVMIYTKGQCEVVKDPITGAIQTEQVPVLDGNGGPVLDGNGDPTFTTEPVVATYIKYHNLLTAGYVAGRDLGQNNAAYTLAYKPRNNVGWVGVKVENITFTNVVAVTGINSDGTVNLNNNGYGNVYIRSFGVDGYWAGKTVTGEWVDQLHLKIYLTRRLRYAIATLMSQSQSLPYDDARGKQRIASAMATEMARAQENGLFSNDLQEWGRVAVRKGTAWIISAEDFIVQSAERQAQRIAPIFDTCYVPAGGVQHVPISICVRLSTQTTGI